MLSVNSKYIPKPGQAKQIINYFKCNRFQDFNTWQQIARCRVEYIFSDNTCKVILRWQDTAKPTFVEEAEAKSRRKAKSVALCRLIHSLIWQGYIGCGFKTADFLEWLPKRRMEESESEDSEPEHAEWGVALGHEDMPALLHVLRDTISHINTSHDTNLSTIPNTNPINSIPVKGGIYTTNHINGIDNNTNPINSIPVKGGIQTANHINGIDNNGIDEEYNDKFGMQHRQSGEVTMVRNENDPPQKQEGSYNQSNAFQQEDLADFITILASQEVQAFRTAEHTVSPPLWQIHRQVIPSSAFINRKQKVPNINLLTSFFPIEGRKLFTKNHTKIQQQHLLPQFQQKSPIGYKALNSLHDTLLFKAQNMIFSANVLMCLSQIQDVSLHENKCSEFQHQSPTIKSYSQEQVSYFLTQRCIATSSFLQTLADCIKTASVTVQGMLDNPLSPFIYRFEPKQPEDIIKRKTSNIQSQSKQYFSPNDYILLTSKITSKSYIGLLMDNEFKTYVPFMQLTERQPFTMKKLYNRTMFKKITAAILAVSRDYLHVLRGRTTLMMQPITYPVTDIIAQLIAEWSALKQPAVIVSLHATRLREQLSGMGYNIMSSGKSNSSTNIHAYCIYPSQVTSQLLRNRQFTRVCIDEAHMVPQLQALIIISKGCEYLYLIGDRYLPSHKYSLYNKLINAISPITLTSANTDAPTGDIMLLGWPQSALYNGHLKCKPTFHYTPIIKGFPWPSPNHRIGILHYAARGRQQAHLCCRIIAAVLRSKFIAVSAVGISVEDQQQQKEVEAVSKQYFEEKIVSVVSGSRYSRKEMGVMLIKNQGYQHINAALQEYSRGVVIVGDMGRIRQNKGWMQFYRWAEQRNLVRKYDDKQNIAHKY